MAVSYLALNLIFLAAGSVVAWLAFRGSRPAGPSRAWWLTLLGLLMLTAVFDNLIIAAGLVAYDPAKLLGLYAGLAPVEDFFYALSAVILVPAVWRLTGRKGTRL